MAWQIPNNIFNFCCAAAWRIIRIHTCYGDARAWLNVNGFYLSSIDIVHDAPSTSGLLLGLTVCRRRLRFTRRISADCIDFVGFSKTVSKYLHSSVNIVTCVMSVCLFFFNTFRTILRDSLDAATRIFSAANRIFSLIVQYRVFG